VKEVCNTKDEKLIPYKEMVSKLLQHFDEYELENVPRNNNKYASPSIDSIDIKDEQTILIIKNLS